MSITLSDKDANNLLNLLDFLGGLILLPFAIALRGYVLSWLWLWFLVPIFELNALTVSQAVVVAFVSQMLIGRLPTRKIPDEEKIGAVASFVQSAILHGLFLGIGWVLSCILTI